MRIAYIIPQFPGQTHIFFWRERKALQRLGVEVVILSTRRPSAGTVCHSWSDQAIAQTTYLTPSTPVRLAVALWTLASAGPRRCWRAAGMLRQIHRGQRLRRLKSLALLLAAGGAVRTARRQGIAHLHAHSCGNSATVALLVRLLADVPYSMTLHGPLSMYGPGQVQKWRHASFGVAVSRRLCKEVHQHVPDLPADHVQVAPMGVDLDVFGRPSAWSAPADGEPWRLVSCGRLHRGKGHQELIEAVGLLRQRGHRVQLTILGEGPYRGPLERQIAGADLADTVSLCGAVSEDAVRDRLAESHVFALASHDEALGVATMEAMAMGLPVVVTDVGGVSELVRQGVDGLLVPPENPAAMADGIESLLGDPQGASKMGTAGALRVRERFSADVSAEVIARHLGMLGVRAIEDDVTPMAARAGQETSA